MAETSFVVFCPECNMLVKAKAVAEGHGSPFHEDTVALLDDVDKPYRCDHYSVCNCSPGGSTGYSLSWLRQSTAFPCRAMVVATSGL